MVIYVALAACLVILGYPIYRHLHIKNLVKAAARKQQLGIQPIDDEPAQSLGSGSGLHVSWVNKELLPWGLGCVYLIVLVWALQNGIPFNSLLWAFLGPVGLVGLAAGIYFMPRVFSAEALDIPGAPPAPSTQVILRKTTFIFITVVLAVMLLSRGMSHILADAPVFRKTVYDIGVGKTVSDIVDDPWILGIGLAVLYAIIYGSVNTVIRPEYVRPDKSSLVPGISNLGSARTPTTSAASVASAQSSAAAATPIVAANMPKTMFWGWVWFLLVMGALGYGAYFVASWWSSLPSYPEWRNRTFPEMFKQVPTPTQPAVPGQGSQERHGSLSQPAPVYTLPESAWATLTPAEVNRERRYQLYPRYARIEPNYWWSIPRPDAEAQSINYVVVAPSGSGHFLIQVCGSGHTVEVVFQSPAFVSCPNLVVRSDVPAIVYFIKR